MNREFFNVSVQTTYWRTRAGKTRNDRMTALAHVDCANSCPGFVLFLAPQILWLSLAFSMTLGWAVTFENFQNFPLFSIFFDLKQFINKNKFRYPPKCVLFALFNYSSLTYIFLALSSTSKNFNFLWLSRTKIKFRDFLGLENEILRFHDFAVFPDLYEPCCLILQLHKIVRFVTAPGGTYHVA